MAFLLNNIGYIIMGILALGVMGGGSGDSDDDADEYAAIDEAAWANSKVNPNCPSYEGI